jgi:NCS1 family nucleobase:cation symporter-1
VALWAGIGLFTSCVLLEVADATIVTAGRTAVDPSSFTDLLPTAIGKLTLLAICLGAVSANVLNDYSGAMSFVAIGLKLPLHRARAVVAVVAVVFGLIGLVVASFGLNNAGTDYQTFLLVIAYRIGPWFGVVFVDRLLRRGRPTAADAQDRAFRNWPGPIAMLVGGSGTEGVRN